MDNFSVNFDLLENVNLKEENDFIKMTNKYRSAIR